MDKIKEMIKNDKKTFIIVLVLLIGIVVAWDVWSNGNVSNDRGGIDGLSERLGTVEGQQHSVTDSLGKIEGGLIESASTSHRITEQLGEIGTTNTKLIERNAESKTYLDSSGGIIERLQRRLEGVRERGKIEN